jgi:ankyrin repeat protein
MKQFPVLCAVMATSFYLHAAAAELPAEAQRMLDDLGSTARMQKKNNKKARKCLYGGTKKITVIKRKDTTIYKGDYNNCREPGSTRDGCVEVTVKNGEIVSRSSKPSINSELYEAVSSGDIAKAEALIASKADVNFTEKVEIEDVGEIDGWTPLMEAVNNGDAEMVKLLVKSGAWVNYLNSTVGNALLLAAGNGDLEIVRYLLANGAYLNNRNMNDITPLMAASVNGHAEVAKSLLDAKAELNYTSRGGDSALILALANNHTDVAQLLVDAGGDVNIRNRSGETALLIAISENNEAMVRTLIKLGADSTIRSDSGKSAQDLAAASGNKQIMEMIAPSFPAPVAAPIPAVIEAESRPAIQNAVLMSTAVPVTEAAFEKRMARGVAALDAGNSALAIEEFREAVKGRPSDPEAALYLAVAFGRAGNPEAEPALINALRLEPGSPRINLELGVLYYNQKMYEEAGDYFENMLGLKPDAEMRAAAEGYLANIRSQGSGKRWGIALVGGMQYDSNVPLTPDSEQLPVGIDRRGDWRGVLNLVLTGVGYRDSSQEVTGSYSLYQTLHLHLTNFNLTQNMIDVGYRRHISKLFTAKVNGGFESVLLGGNQFVQGFTITPGLLATLREGMMTGLDYRYHGSYFKDSDTFPANSDRDGATHSVMLTHRQALSEALNLRVGYTFEREVAKVSSWSSSSHQGNAGLAVSLPHSLLLDISMDAATRKYDDVLPPATEIRSDSTITGGASLTWQAYERLGVSVGYLYSKNYSNLPEYDYSRSVNSIMLQGRY